MSLTHIIRTDQFELKSHTSIFQQTSGMSNFVQTSQSSLLQHTSATSAITSNAFPAGNSTNLMNTSERGNYFFSSNNTFANSTHIHGSGAAIGLTNISMTSASNGLSLSVNPPGAGGGGSVYAGDNISLSTNGVSTTVSVVGAVLTSQSSLFQHTSATSAITASALNTSQSSLFQHTSATSAITSAAQHTSLMSNYAPIGVSARVASFNGVSSQISVNAGSNLSLSQGAGASSTAFTFNVTGVVPTSQSSLFQHTSATSAITASALNTSQSSLFQHTSATSAITSNAMNTSERGNYFYTSNNTFANQTHLHGTGTQVAGTNISITSASNGLSLSVAAPGAAAENNWMSLIGNVVGNSTASGSTIALSGGANVTLSGTNGSVVVISAGGGGGGSVYAGDYVSLSSNGASTTISVTGLQATSATSAITANALNTSQSSLFQHTSATSAITASALNTSQSSLFQHTSATSAITSAAQHTSLMSNYAPIGATAHVVSFNGVSNQISVNPGSNLSLSQGTGTQSTAFTFNVTGVLQTSQSSLFQHTSATSAITASALNTSQSSLFQHTSATSAITSAAQHTSLMSNYAPIGVSARVASFNGVSSQISVNAGSNLSLSQGTGTQSTAFTFNVTAVLNTSQSSLFQHTSATSAITSAALHTSQSSLLQHTSATSAITSAAFHTSQSSLFMNTSERANYFYTSNNTFANSTHSHGNPTLNLTNLTGTTASNSAGFTISLSANAPGAAAEANAHFLIGNTAGSSQVTGSTIYLSGGSNITLSGTSNTIGIVAGGGGGSISANIYGNTATSPGSPGETNWAGSVLNLSAGQNVTINVAATNGSIQFMAAGQASLNAFEPYPHQPSGSILSQYTNYYFNYFNLAAPLAMSKMYIAKSINCAIPSLTSRNSSHYLTHRFTQNVTWWSRVDYGASSSLLSSIASASMSWEYRVSFSSSSASMSIIWQTNSTGGTTSMSKSTNSAVDISRYASGLQFIQVPIVTTLPAGEVWIAHSMVSASTSSGNATALLYCAVSAFVYTNQVNSFSYLGATASLSTQYKAFMGQDGWGHCTVTANPQYLSNITGTAAMHKMYQYYLNLPVTTGPY